MYQGIVTTKKWAASFDPVTESWEKVCLLEEDTVKNSVTAAGIIAMLDGQMFGTGTIPVIHVYSHQETITPAVAVVSGWLAECDPVGGVVTTQVAEQAYITKTVTGRLDPPGVTRTIKTVGLSSSAAQTTPSFAVRLTNPVVQAPAQIVEISYSLVARKANNTTAAAAGGTVSKVSNNSWSRLFELLYGAESGPAFDPVVIGTLDFLHTPDDFSTGSSLSTKNSLVENLGQNAANRIPSGVGPTPVITSYADEGTVQLASTISFADLIGKNLNKSLISVNTAGTHLYVNDIGYGGTVPVYTCQNLYQHSTSSTYPYPTTLEGLASGTGMVDVVVPGTGITSKFPVYVRAVVKSAGAVGSAEYFLQTRFTIGFVDNLADQEDIYLFPALDDLSSSGETNVYDSGLAYTGRPVLTDAGTLSATNDAPLNVFPLRHSTVSGSDYVGNANQSDAIALMTRSEVFVVSNLGTTVYEVSSSTMPSFTATAIRAAATVNVSGLARTFIACSSTGLWRMNEVLAGETYSPGVPFQVAVPIVDTTKCYAVASREIRGEVVVFAAFEGGLARTLNGGTSWQVYAPSGGALPFTEVGITDDWDAVTAIIPGPTNVATGVSVIALVTTGNDIVFVEMTNADATATSTVTTIADVGAPATDAAFAVQKRNAYFKTPISADVPSSQTWVFQAGPAGDLYLIDYVVGSGTSAPVLLDSNFQTIKTGARFFEALDATESQFGLVGYGDTEASVVLIGSDGLLAVDLDSPLSVDQETRFTSAACKSYRHFYFSVYPEPCLFNPFASASLFGGANEHLVWRSYEWTGSEWQRYVSNAVTVAPYPLDGRTIHSSTESIFSTGPNGILQDLPSGIEFTFADNGTTSPFIDDESFTFTLTSGIQKDEYTSLSSTVVHSFYRSEPVIDADVVLMSGPDFVNKPLDFVTRGVETQWFSQRGVLSSTPTTTATIRSELVTPGEDQDFSFKFKVTEASSTGTFTVGVVREDLPADISGGDTLDSLYPVRIDFSGSSYQVFRGASSATAVLGIPNGAEFTVSVAAGEFEISVNGTPLALSTASTLPAALIGTRLAVGAYADLNQNRYAYDLKVAGWPATDGSVAYYKLMAAAVDVTADPLFVSVESRATPASFVVGGVDNTVDVIVNPAFIVGVGGADDEIKLLPKTGIILVNDVSSIGTATATCVLLKK